MDDLISRRTLLEKFSKNSIYEHITNADGKNVLEIISEQPTAFDLESVIEQLNERIKTYENFNSDDEIVDVAIKEIQRDLDILNSAANATNGKIGG